MASAPAAARDSLRLDVQGTGVRVAERALHARTWRARMVGLLAHESLPTNEALIFEGCSSIHTFGMRFPIDVIFIDRQWHVVALRECLKPGRLVWPVRRAWGVIETACGTLKRTKISVGDTLQIST
jgi:uncharacterized membrane protein (UPF0127 family)